MVSIALGIFILAILYVIFWSMKNDKARSIDEQTGFIRMREPTLKNKETAGRSNPRAAPGARLNLPKEAADTRPASGQETHRPRGRQR